MLVLNDFKFLANWPNYKEEEKMIYYDKYNCNEFNFFLKNKDEKFFNNVVKMLLSNRIQKSFFDYYLLGNKEQCIKYSKRLDLYHTLNEFEKILLTEICNNKDLTNNLLKKLNDVILLKSDQIQQFNALFEQALHAKQFEVNTLDNNIGINNNLNNPDDGIEVDLKEETNEISDYIDLSRTLQECRYYKVSYNNQTPGLVNPNAYWRDYAEYLLNDKNKNRIFLSSNFGFAANNSTEALLALSVIDLSFRGDHNEVFMDDNTKNELKSYKEGCIARVEFNGPTMLLTREVIETKFQSSSLAVTTNYFDPSDKLQEIDFEMVDKFVSNDKFVSGKRYGCRIVITNVSSVTFSVQVLCQIPTGSIPILNGFRTKNFIRELSSYATTSIEYYFYFPKDGNFKHYPAHISRNGEVIGYSLEKCDIVVYDLENIKDTSSWKYISSKTKSTTTQA